MLITSEVMHDADVSWSTTMPHGTIPVCLTPTLRLAYLLSLPSHHATWYTQYVWPGKVRSEAWWPRLHSLMESSQLLLRNRSFLVMLQLRLQHCSVDKRNQAGKRLVA